MIVISNPSKQHTPNTIQSCNVNNKKVIWLTSFWYKPDQWYWRLVLSVFPSFKAQILKRYSHLISVNVVKFNGFGMFLFFFGRFIYSTERRNFLEDSWHDLWVSKKINKIKPDFIIGYEKSCHKSFNAIKKNGGIAVLDLAQVHVNYIGELRERFNFFKDITGSENLFCTIRYRKIKEYELANYILVLSSFAKQTLLNEGVAPSKIHLVNLGFDPSRFIPKFFYPTNQDTHLRIIYSGIITKRKGVHLIASVAKSLQHLAIEWVFIGSKDDGFKCIEGFQNIRYIPYLEHEELLKEFHNSDIFVLPSYLDSWGMVVVEAMACGLPVIVSENTGAKDAVTIDCGFVIPIDDQVALADKVLYFYNNRTEIERMGRSASKEAQKYTWDNYHKQVGDFINKISS